jgi:hypothetical protein
MIVMSKLSQMLESAASAYLAGVARSLLNMSCGRLTLLAADWATCAALLNTFMLMMSALAVVICAQPLKHNR